PATATPSACGRARLSSTLLEQQYALVSRRCNPLIGEDQLSTNFAGSQVNLLKLHGDLSHSQRLIVTERDYDTFLSRFPIVATFLANLLITRTPVLIGYSFDDPDFRQLWEMIGERLGRDRPRAYALCVGASLAEVARFERRGITAINLAQDKNRYGEVLRNTFQELKQHWLQQIISHSHILEEQLLQQSQLPADAANNLCHFVLPLTVRPFYRQHVFPVIRSLGLVPVTVNDVVSPPGSEVAMQEALIHQAAYVVIDASNGASLETVLVADLRRDSSSVLAVIEDGTKTPTYMRGIDVIQRPAPEVIDTENFLRELDRWFRDGLEKTDPALARDAHRLFNQQEYSAAVLSAITYLETKLRYRIDIPSPKSDRFMSLRKLVETAKAQGYLAKYETQQILSWLKVRNNIAHTNSTVTRDESIRIIVGVEEIMGSNRWRADSSHQLS
ncbi:MAG: SIR2 family protein, partial [Spirochaetaceae bacterium]|nr:SIR2 family protein [Spirochaetaceae bacterium]